MVKAVKHFLAKEKNQHSEEKKLTEALSVPWTAKEIDNIAVWSHPAAPTKQKSTKTDQIEDDIYGKNGRVVIRIQSEKRRETDQSRNGKHEA